MQPTKFVALGHNAKPSVAKADDAGIDLRYHSNIPLNIAKKHLYKIHTGVFVEIDKDSCGIIFERSGLGSKHGVIIHGRVIDPGYRGEVIVIMSINDLDILVETGMDMHNAKEVQPLTFQPGDKVAQMVIVPKNSLIQEVEHIGQLSNSERGDAGLGSTGKA